MIAAAELRFEPHEDRGRIRAFILAAVMHCALFAFLYFGISWTNQPAAPAQADLWTALPPMSAPPRVTPPPPQPEPPKPVVEPTPTPPPPPVNADIKIKEQPKKEPPKIKEQPKKEEPPKKKEPPKAEPPKKEPPPKPVPPKQEAKPEFKPMDDIQAALRQEENQRRKTDISKQAADEMKGGAPSSGSSDAWLSKVGSMLRTKIPAPISNAVATNSPAILEITILPTSREVLSVRVVKSSGNPAFDEAARQAVQEISPLPPPTAGMPPLTRLITYKAYPKD